MFPDLVKKVDAFMDKYSLQEKSNKREMYFDLLELVQEAIRHGEDKDQNKIVGILVKAAKAFLPGQK